MRSSCPVRCKTCQMSPFYTSPTVNRPFTRDCPDCLGTNRDTIPWEELFPWRRRR